MIPRLSRYYQKWLLFIVIVLMVFGVYFYCRGFEVNEVHSDDGITLNITFEDDEHMTLQVNDEEIHIDLTEERHDQFLFYQQHIEECA